MAVSKAHRDLLLDSWPIMEWLKKRQPASGAFHALAEKALQGSVSLVMSRMNYGEVVYPIPKDIPLRHKEALQAFLEIPIRLVSIDDRLVDEAADLKAVYRISYADAFAAALSLRLGIPLVTGDREFYNLMHLGLQIEWLGA